MTDRQRSIVIALPIGIILLFILIRLTNVLNYYTIPTPSMEPAFPAGKCLVLASRLKHPAPGDIVCYRYEDGSLYFKRLMALEGDNLEVRNGLAYVNGKLMDDSTRLKFSYFVSGSHASADARKIVSAGNILEFNQDSCIAFLSLKEKSLIDKHLKKVRHVFSSADAVELFFHKGHPSWTFSNFGPIAIPKGFCFVMGDNRDNSVDSRFTGYTSLEDVVSTIIWYKTW